MNYFVRKALSFVIVIFCIISFSGFALAQTLIVILGDSLTEGFGVAKEEAYPHLLEKELQRHSVKVINAGISGSTSASAPSRLRWYIKAHPEIVILALGGNDGLRGLSVKHMKKNLSKAIELAQSEKILILLAGMQIPQNYGTEYTESFLNAFHELARHYKLHMIPFLLREVGGVSSLNQADGIHPNPEGHQIIVRTVVEYLEPLLPTRQ